MLENMEEIKKQVVEWKSKTWAIPELRGKKQIWYQLVSELVTLIRDNTVYDLKEIPELSFSTDQWCWKDYLPFLRGVGLVWNQAETLKLTKDGIKFSQEPTKRLLADQIQKNYRLFGEILYLLLAEPLSGSEIDKQLCTEYCLDWKNLSNTRRRLEWLEILGMIQAMGNYKWSVTEEGKKALEKWCIVRPESLALYQSRNTEVVIEPAPREIEKELCELRTKSELQQQRCTYNMSAPGPNYIDNLRKIVRFSKDKVSKAELFQFIKSEYGLGESSAETMLPFLKAGGLLEERERGTYCATKMSKAWEKTGNQLDFIRIIHLRMRFVGEVLYFAREEITRNKLYKISQQYGFNVEKTRWICKFLMEAGLLEETRYLHLKTTVKGNAFEKTLPLNILNESSVSEKSFVAPIDTSLDAEIKDKWKQLNAAATNPNAGGKIQGAELEEQVADLFRDIGFEAARIGGPGDTDVILRWEDEKERVAIVDTKSKSSGQVSHGDISEIALEAHKEKNRADYVVVIGPGFAGNTIKNFAQKKGYALITIQQLTEIADSAERVGLTLQEIAVAFQGLDGMQHLNEIIERRTRELDVISMIVQQFKDKQEVFGSLSPRDIFWQLEKEGRKIDVNELIAGFQILVNEQIEVLQKVEESRKPEDMRYRLYKVNSAVNRMKALAKAVENGKNNDEMEKNGK